MKSISLFKQLLTGFVLSLLATISIHSLSLFNNYHDAFNVTLMLTSFLYLASILKNSQIKTGQPIVLGFFLLTTIFNLFFNLSSQFTLAFCLASLFITRIIYYQHQLTSAFYDLALISLGLLVASGVLVSSKSWFLSYWCFFFVQAFLVFASDIFSSNKVQIDLESSTKTNQKFNQAKNQAALAINQLSSH